jgi:hypothetical protein
MDFGFLPIVVVFIIIAVVRAVIEKAKEAANQVDPHQPGQAPTPPARPGGFDEIYRQLRREILAKQQSAPPAPRPPPPPPAAPPPPPPPPPRPPPPRPPGGGGGGVVRAPLPHSAPRLSAPLPPSALRLLPCRSTLHSLCADLRALPVRAQLPPPPPLCSTPPSLLHPRRH